MRLNYTYGVLFFKHHKLLPGHVLLSQLEDFKLSDVADIHLSQPNPYLSISGHQSGRAASKERLLAAKKLHLASHARLLLRIKLYCP